APAGPIHRSPVIAMPLGGVTGVPPWPLGANGLAAGRLEGAAVFAWFDPEARAVVGVVAQADIPAALVTETASPRIAIPDDGTGRLLTLWSDGEAQAFGLACAP
ncbi:MAG: hypothetical protein ABMB14_35855, partial [Myxococcota bacterium]